MKFTGLRLIFFTLLGGFLLYTTLMMIIRLQVTELGYEFEEAKIFERNLREEQVRLQAEISRNLSQTQRRKMWRDLGYRDPEPQQMVVIP